MYLKELTLRGFKSFANPTTLRFEPGITAVVGPNGSGKSNIVDALAWVMGEQGARALRGSTMEDVIFAGTATRPAMGRAQVSLTIDNSDHALDIDYDEVTISRTLFRNGGSDYAINGSPVRLLDVQDLLSDAGLGQQMHVIVGQGQLSRILNSDPQGHRAIIEEAAGILKHRKRKQRSLRRLSAAKTNLDRLDDLLGEIDRQMRPLARQAKAARRADAVRAVARDAGARLLADDASQLLQERGKTLAALEKARADLRARRLELARTKMLIEDIETRQSGSDPELTRLADAQRNLTLIDGRFATLAAQAGERARAAADALAQLDARPLSDPDVLIARARELSNDLVAAQKKQEQAEQRRQEGTQARADAESRLASLRQTLSQLRQARQQHESQVSRLSQLLAAQKQAVTGLDQRLADSERHRKEIASRLDSNQQEVARLSAQKNGEDASVEKQMQDLRSRLSDLGDALQKERAARTDLDNRRIRLTARAEALDDTIRSRHEGTPLASAEGVSPLGPLSEHITVDKGWEEAVAAALSVFSDALLLAAPEQLPAALEAARTGKARRTAVLAPIISASSTHAAGTPVAQGTVASCATDSADHEDTVDHTDGVPSSTDPGLSAVHDDVLPAPGRVIPVIRLIHPAGDGRTDAVRSRDDGAEDSAGTTAGDDKDLSRGILRSLARLLDGIGAAQDARTAFDACREGQWRMIVTQAGEVVTPAAAVTVALGAPSDLALVARRNAAIEEASELRRDVEEADTRIAALEAERDRTRSSLSDLSKKRDEARLAVSRAEEALSIRSRQIASDEKELDSLARTAQGLRHQRQQAVDRQAELSRTLEGARSDSSSASGEEDLTRREESAEKTLSDARDEEVRSRLSAEEASRHADSLDRQIGLLKDEARRATAQKTARARRREALKARQKAADGLVNRIAAVRGLLSACLAQTTARREALGKAAERHQQRLAQLRKDRDGLEPQVDALASTEHSLDLDRERQATRLGQLQEQSSSRTGLRLEQLVDRYGPDRPVPDFDEDGQPVDGASHPYDRKTEQERLEKAQKQIARLGRVNPLAGEEYDALQERQKYLAAQRDDVASSRKQLLGLVDRLDSTMEEVFTSAFADISAAYSRIFADLFPGGRGRLLLDDPDHPLTSGVIVEASPAGKKVRELSLLSGGEKSLSALALLLAISEARPSPFYVMDEVEAALDDLNLTRLLGALKKMSHGVQLIIITHQQRTMAIADALYGVSMRADGVTAVISQKMGDVLPRRTGDARADDTRD